MNSPQQTPLPRRLALVGGILALVLAVSIGVVIALGNGNLPFPVDSSWMAEMVEQRIVWLEVPARFLSWVGGGPMGVVIVPLGIVIALWVSARPWGALYYAIAALLSVGAVQLLKAVFDRPRPEDILVLADAGSFPSGHVANAATTAVVLALILSRRWPWFVGAVYVVLMAFSRTYLGAHWLSDTLGGALLGAGIAFIVWAPLAARIGPPTSRFRHNEPAAARARDRNGLAR